MTMNNKELYNKIYNLLKDGIEWHFQCDADDIASAMTANIIDLLNLYKKIGKHIDIASIDLGDDNV